MDDLLKLETDGPVGIVTLNRPEARNALSSELMVGLRAVMARVGGDDAIHAVVLTGADPAFCAGLDLKELGSTGANLSVVQQSPDGTARFWEQLPKPVIGAINGVAITGGLEVALQCDWLVASERAAFGDTHARVGVMPGGGLTVLLPQAIGVRRAMEMSLTGNFLSASDALSLGLVNRVVPHDSLLEVAIGLAHDVAGIDPAAVHHLLATYRMTTGGTVADGFRIEVDQARAFGKGFDHTTVAAKREDIRSRGRGQLPS